jgi:molybdopterin converting factor small subunit
MEPTSARTDAGETSVVHVRLWAAAKATAGVAGLDLPVAGPLSLSEVVDLVLAGRPDRLAAVLASCSVLVGDRPVSTLDPEQVAVSPGETVEFLPPFAGG